MNGLEITWILVEGYYTPFYIASTPVTFEQYDNFCEIVGYEKPKAEYGRGKQPVINVRVVDAMAFCNWMSKETGTTVRLPREDEWEFAASGGNMSKGFKYSGSNIIDEVAWYSRNSGNKTHEVATKRANELGIYDMSGNVWEYCEPYGWIRGGSFFDGSNDCTVSYILKGIQGFCDSIFGFRVVQIR